MDDARGLYEDLLTASTQYYPHCLNAKWPHYALYLAPYVLFSALHLTKPIDRTTLTLVVSHHSSTRGLSTSARTAFVWSPPRL